MPTDLAQLAPAAHLIVRTIDPPLAPAAATDLLANLGKLLTQFEAEGSVARAGCATAADGRAVVIAWEEPTCGTPLSGCRQDKVAKVLARHETLSQSNILGAPPILIAVAGVPTCLRRTTLRHAVSAGQVDATSPAWDTRATTLAAWRAGCPAPAGTIAWLAPLLVPMQVPPMPALVGQTANG